MFYIRMIELFYNDISNKINTVLKWQLEFRPRFFIVYDSRNSQHFTKILRLKTLVSQRALQYNLQWILILIFLLWKVWLKKRTGNLLQYNFVVLFLSSVCNLFHEKFSWVDSCHICNHTRITTLQMFIQTGEKSLKIH